ncbi:unnamed protein product [Phytophthora fragariaefolia]|uniref:Unnamed protein product n=1 Tax=Phytophthora fragariaefolia TaxID=1490495 RepID=A0A9W7D4G7_9STRA|nr:unnamed protein product [Phytophthora fragariaefolia]
MPRIRTHPAWDELRVGDGTYPDASCNHRSAELFKCQPSRNLIMQLTQCPGFDEAEQVKWIRFREPLARHKRKRQKRKKRSKTQSPGATQDSIMTEASQAQSHPTMPFAGDVTNEDNSRFQSDIARSFYATDFPFGLSKFLACGNLSPLCNQKWRDIYQPEKPWLGGS